MTYTMQRMTSSGWPADVNILALDVIYETQQRLHFKVCSIYFITCIVKVTGHTFRGNNPFILSLSPLMGVHNKRKDFASIEANFFP